MSIATKYNKGSKFNFTWPTADTAVYCKLSDLYKANPNAIHKVRAMLIGTKGNFGDEPILALDSNTIVNCPKHMLDTIRAMLLDDALIEAVNNGDVSIKVYTYQDKKFNKICYSVEWM